MDMLCTRTRTQLLAAPFTSTSRPALQRRSHNHHRLSAHKHGSNQGDAIAGYKISFGTVASFVALGTGALLMPEAAEALTIRQEPANALSLPTWAIHVSSVLEWVTAMVLMWKYAEVSGNSTWKGMTWAMMPSLGSAMAACTWHFFYNSPDLEFLVALQAFLTVMGNIAFWVAAYRIHAAAQAESQTQ
eukprot:jgi/Chrzof1/1543/Cz10g11230.t1